MRARVEREVHTNVGMETRPRVRPICRPRHSAQINMIGSKGKVPTQESEPAREEKSARNMLLLCTCCKTEMMEKDWDDLLVHVLEEEEDWFAFIFGVEGTNRYSH